MTFKVDIDLTNGQPLNTLLAEGKTFFKNELGLDIATAVEACNNPKVLELVRKAVERTNARAISRAAHIRKFKFLPVDFSLPGGELGPTLKLRRKEVVTKYKQLIDEMFAFEAKL